MLYQRWALHNLSPQLRNLRTTVLVADLRIGYLSPKSCGVASCWSEKFKSSTATDSRLTRVPMGVGGETAHSSFLPIDFFPKISSQKRNKISIKYFIPLQSSVLHTLTKGFFPMHLYVGHKWRQSDIMSSRFLSKIRVRGNLLYECSFKDRVNWFSTKHAEWPWLWNCSLSF